MRISLISGGFDPIHRGHINYIRAAKELGDELCVGLNSNDWLERKKGKFFMPFYERKEILLAIFAAITFPPQRAVANIKKK